MSENHSPNQGQTPDNEHLTDHAPHGDSHGPSPSAYKMAACGIFVVLVAYFLSAIFGLPQKGTELKLHAHHDDHHVAADAGTDTATTGEIASQPTEENVNQPTPAETTAEAAPASEAQTTVNAESHAAQDADAQKGKTLPPFYMIIPFAALLLAIALLPLIPFTEHWWESNLHRFYVAAVLGILTLIYYGFMYPDVVVSHWPGHGFSTEAAGSKIWTVFANAIINEFIPFIVLLFALFTIAGGIRVEGNLAAKPGVNTAFIGIGALLASFVGTTGAAMLLIRPLLETNRERKLKVHTVIFFIFAVCNCGGCLLPTGDPPLFLGYLGGVGFLWTINLWKEWLFVNALLLAVYYAWDRFYAYPREVKSDISRDENQKTSLKFSGLLLNVPLLVGVVLAVALLDPSKTFPGTDWHPWMFMREIVQLGLVFLSLACGSVALRLANNFNFHAIVEVAALFFGIFITMQVPLQILNEKGDQLGLTSAKQFYWTTGSLSAVLDNAPTYVVFKTTAETVTKGNPELSKDTEAGVNTKLLVAISLGAVFMGAMTYIGNGPNFMVKAIAEQEGIKMPSFFGYMAYSCAILLPILFIMTLIFL
ncbi:MAG: sodium:proton antiporter [Planctomycetia bacterium]|nr:sodium:proton antiporter [Planctomycetia bacterium]